MAGTIFSSGMILWLERKSGRGLPQSRRRFLRDGW